MFEWGRDDGLVILCLLAGMELSSTDGAFHVGRATDGLCGVRGRDVMVNPRGPF